MEVVVYSSVLMEKIMNNVEYFDWKLHSAHPVSYLLRSYPEQVQNRPPDMHSALHLGLVLHGERTGRFAGETVRSIVGEFYLTAPWEPHSTIRTGPENRLLLLNIDRESLQRSFFTGGDRLEQLILMSPGDRMGFLNRKLQGSSLKNELVEMIWQPDSAEKELLLWNLVQKIFIALLPEEGAEGCRTEDYQRLLPALQSLSGEVLTLDEAAQRCRLSPGYFSTIFKKQFGLSFGRYERNFRLNGAAAAIRQGATLKEAADLWGFCDKSHLARLLKKRR